jgi:serine/threonine protein kinase
MPNDDSTTPPRPPNEQQDELATLPPSPGVAASATERPVVLGYEILSELGRGGMGVVYKARQVNLNRIVALKMILSAAHAGQADLARFRLEAEAIARLQHPNIVQVFEIGEQGGLPWFALEYCSGGSLDKKLAGTPIEAKVAAHLVRTLAEAMHAAHQANVIHRDLKPANILLSFSRDAESAERSAPEAPVAALRFADSASRLNGVAPKITDFGLAKKLDEQGQTQTGAIMGTPSYMAPEQASGTKDVGPAADVYALGAILYECLTGRPPFRAATPLDTLMQVVTEEPVPPRLLQAKVPRDVETICLKCLEKTPQRRYESAAALAEDLHRFLQDESIKARRPGLAERGLRWLRKQGRQAVLTAAVSAAVLLAVLGGTLASGWYIEHQKGEVELVTDGPTLTAEVFGPGDQSPSFRFRVPTVDPVRLKAGVYRVRFSSSGLPSEESQVLVARGGQHAFEVDLRGQELWPAVAASGAQPALLPCAGRTDLILQGVRALRRIDGSTGQESLIPLPAGIENVSQASMLEPAADIDGDGQADMVWTQMGGPALFVLSGADHCCSPIAACHQPLRACVWSNRRR